MSAQILNGKKLSLFLEQELKTTVEKRKILNQKIPGLAVILVGNDAASEVYVANKRKACARVGFNSFAYNLPSSVTEAEILLLINDLNENNEIDGILVQLPLPPQVNTLNIIKAIDPLKDVDGFHPYNIGLLSLQAPCLRACTPAGIMTLLASTGIALQGLNATIIGISNIVGRPMILELLQAGCTVTACHKKTKDLPFFVKNADILIVAIGKPNIIKGEWIKKGAIIVDVGINRLPNGKMVGDIEFEKAAVKASWITPVPGGVGPMTVISLLQNTLYATLLREAQVL
ncbi:MAG: bifunctional methylenetetrahydrofolate dehydrogenase/methenyltetrahydrofolate cyclohydrolase [Francisellaceae bacterium]|nr:bifunctional methylenetetrahydrofolate dehydrogenase/methenyltetrahydrofolate cyclohydrolase [Francisellaceae bacterium]